MEKNKKEQNIKVLATESESPDGVTTTTSSSSSSSVFSAKLKQFSYVSNTDQNLVRRSPRLIQSGIVEELASPDQSTTNLLASLKRSGSAEDLSPPARANKRQRRSSSKYAAPSRYAHLAPLVDILEPNLICVFVGVNPGIMTSQRGHAYAHPSNLFWKLLHSSGCTDRRCKPEEDRDLPRLYSMGNTNIVERPTKDQSELSKMEMVDATERLEAKVRWARPEAVCIVGKGIWEAIWRFRHSRAITKAEFHYGWQADSENMGRSEQDLAQESPTTWKGARVYVTCSTSGASASLRPHEKEAIWKPFGDWVMKRREDRSRE